MSVRPLSLVWWPSLSPLGGGVVPLSCSSMGNNPNQKYHDCFSLGGGLLSHFFCFRLFFQKKKQANYEHQAPLPWVAPPFLISQHEDEFSASGASLCGCAIFPKGGDLLSPTSFVYYFGTANKPNYKHKAPLIGWRPSLSFLGGCVLYPFFSCRFFLKPTFKEAFLFVPAAKTIVTLQFSKTKNMFLMAPSSSLPSASPHRKKENEKAETKTTQENYSVACFSVLVFDVMSAMCCLYFLWQGVNISSLGREGDRSGRGGARRREEGVHFSSLSPFSLVDQDDLRVSRCGTLGASGPLGATAGPREKPQEKVTKKIFWDPSLDRPPHRTDHYPCGLPKTNFHKKKTICQANGLPFFRFVFFSCVFLSCVSSGGRVRLARMASYSSTSLPSPFPQPTFHPRPNKPQSTLGERETELPPSTWSVVLEEGHSLPKPQTS